MLRIGIVLLPIRIRFLFQILNIKLGHANITINVPVPEIIDPVFAKTSPIRSFSMTEYERFGLVFTKTRVNKFGHWCLLGRYEVVLRGDYP